MNAITLPDFFSLRYRDDKNILMAIAAVVIIVFFVPYTASGFAACGKLFSSLFGIDYMLAMVVSAAVIVIYCTLGGFLAASTTDFVQSIVMTIALFVVVGFTEGMVHGFDTVFANVQGLDGYLNLFEGFNVGTGTTGSYGALPVASTLAWGLGYFGMPQVLLRFMAIRKASELKKSRRIATVWVVISLAAAVAIGIIGRAMLPTAETLLTKGGAENVFVLMSETLLPPVLAGVIMAGILAATISSSDSYLLIASSAFAKIIILILPLSVQVDNVTSLAPFVLLV